MAVDPRHRLRAPRAFSSTQVIPAAIRDKYPLQPEAIADDFASADHVLKELA